MINRGAFYNFITLMRAAGRRRRQRGAAGAIVYVLSMSIVHLSAMSILNRPFFDVAEMKINSVAAKNARPGGPLGSLGVGESREGPRDAL